MKTIKVSITAIVLAISMSSTVFAGNIPTVRGNIPTVNGNIPTDKNKAGNIPTDKNRAGNIPTGLRGNIDITTSLSDLLLAAIAALY